jgi:HK97 family phage major capsid protein
MTELEARLATIDARLAEINAQFQDRRFDDSTRQEWHNLNAERDELAATLQETRLRHQRLLDLAGDPHATERVGDGQGSDATPVARPGDLLGPGQSVSDWLRRTSRVRDSQQPQVSFDRYLRALIGGEATRPQAALSEGTLTAGGHLVPSPLAAKVIDLARNAMRVMQAGATTIPMTSNTLKVPRLTAEGTPGWHAENAAISAADLTFDAVTFDAQTLTRLVVLSVELFEDSDPSAEGVIANSFAAQIALEIDRAALRGSGTAPEPCGVLNQTGITALTHGANGSVIGSPPAAGTVGWEFLVDSVAAVRNANFEPNAQIMAPRTPQSLAKLRDTTNQYISPPSYLDGITRLQSKQVPVNLTVGTSTDCSEVYTAQWSMLMLGIRTQLRILPLRERFIDNGQYGFLAWMRCDVQLAQPAAFAVDTGVRS